MLMICLKFVWREEGGGRRVGGPPWICHSSLLADIPQSLRTIRHFNQPVSQHLATSQIASHILRRVWLFALHHFLNSICARRCGLTCLPAWMWQTITSRADDLLIHHRHHHQTQLAFNTRDVKSSGPAHISVHNSWGWLKLDNLIMDKPLRSSIMFMTCLKSFEGDEPHLMFSDVICLSGLVSVKTELYVVTVLQIKLCLFWDSCCL